MDFDYFLYQLTDSEYATRWENASLEEIHREGKVVNLMINKNQETIELSGQMIIAADGSRSIAKKKLLGDEVDEKHYCAGIRAYYKGVKDLHPQNFIELHFYKELLPGYFWIFPLPNGYANVGMGMLSKKVSEKKINLRKEMLHLIETHPALKDRFKDAVLDGKINGWGLPLGSKKRPLSGEQIILTGDAASLIDPFTGEGIGNAGVSGMVAARIAKSAIENQNFSADFLKQYDQIIYDKLWNELQLSYRIQRLSSIPWLFNFVVNKITNNKQLREIFTNMFIDLDLRAKLKSPMFYFKLLFNR
jgi:flavin-dependent dehydrogenase